jgi:hypothetical protein
MTAKNDGNAQALVVAREVLLSVSYPLLNLYLWELVARRPRSEVIPMICTEERRRWHSASWDRWGFPGEALKWVSLASLLTVPILQLVWRLVPTQRQESAIYVADSVLEITLFIVFILKLLLNAHSSLSKPFWQAIRSSVAPILMLIISLGLSVGNLVYCRYPPSLDR